MATNNGTNNTGQIAANSIRGNNTGAAALGLDLSAAQVKTLLSLVTANQKDGQGSGTAYTLTNSQAAITLGTTSPSIVINSPGTYLLIARLRVDYNGATFAAPQTFGAAIRRTNNTAADIKTVNATTAVITTQTYTFIDQTFFITYTTVNSDDALALFGLISAVPSAGSIQVAQADLIAIRLQQ